MNLEHNHFEPIARFLPSFEPGTFEESGCTQSNYISHALTTRLMRDITEILQL